MDEHGADGLALVDAMSDGAGGRRLVDSGGAVSVGCSAASPDRAGR
jgi:hypothetical protein